MSLTGVGQLRSRWSAPAGLALALMGVAGGNVVFHLGAGRLLRASEYSSLSALLTILLALAVPAGAIQVGLTAEVTRTLAAGRGVGYTTLARRFMLAGLGIALVIEASSPLVGPYLRIGGALPLALVGLFFVPALGGLVYRSVLLGEQRYGTLAGCLIGGTALRIVLGLCVLPSFPNAIAALSVLLVSEVLTTTWLYLACHHHRPRRQIVWELQIQWRQLLGGISAFLGFWLLLGVDALLARHRLSSAEAGAYAASAFAAKIVLYAPQSIVTAALPRYAAGGIEGRRALMESLVPTIFVGLVGAAFIVFLGPSVLGQLLGDSFQLSRSTLAHLATAALWAAILTALINFHLSEGAALRANVSWAGAGIVVLGGHFTDRSVTLSLTVLVGVLLAGLLASSPIIRSTRERVDPTILGPSTIDLSLVLPAYNEGPRISRFLGELTSLLDREAKTYEILVVDDGSEDDTLASALSLGHPAIRGIGHDHNRGKGAALRTGLTQARGDVVGFVDADGEIAADHVLTVVAALHDFDADFAVGSKNHPLAVDQRSALRGALSSVSRTMIRALFAISASDTQVGLKFMRRSVLEVLPHTRENGYLFDLELLAFGRQLGFGHIVEVPVTVTRCGSSSVSCAAIARSFLGVGLLAWRMASSPRADARLPLTAPIGMSS